MSSLTDGPIDNPSQDWTGDGNTPGAKAPDGSHVRTPRFAGGIQEGVLPLFKRRVIGVTTDHHNDAAAEIVAAVEEKAEARPEREMRQRVRELSQVVSGK
ncbi:MAG: hypothetical protein ACK4RK_09550 [Gemmataceae bacterium]